MQPIKIFFFLMERTPYHDLLLESLGRMDSVTLQAFFAKSKSERRPWEFTKTRPNFFYCNSWQRYLRVFLRKVMQEQPRIVIIGGYADRKLLLSYFLLKLLQIDFAMWTDVPQVNLKRPVIKNIARLSLLKWLFKNALAIFTMGQPGIDAFKALGCPEAKIKDLPCAIDLDAYRHVSSENKEKAALLKNKFALTGEAIFLGAGRLSEEKGYDLAVRAFAKCLAISPGCKAILWLAGDGPQRKELEELTNNLGLTGKVHFWGWQQPQEMQVLFASADVLVNPSRWDQFGAAVLEAMAWGLPVLASDQTMAAVDRVEPGKNGFIHRVGDVDEIANHMLALLDTPAMLSRLGAQARKKAEEWPVSRCARTIMEIICDPPFLG